MMPAAKPATGPAAGSAWRSSWPGSPRPLASGHLNLADLPTTPFWARRGSPGEFLDACKDVPTQTIETAELVVSRTRHQCRPVLRRPDPHRAVHRA